jgi:hypothetical protein
MNIPSNPADRKKIEQALQEISNSLTRSEAERDLIKDIIKTTCEQFELDKKIFRRMAKVYHRRNFNEEVAEHEQFEVMYETITNTVTITPVKVTRSNVSNVYETADISEGGELD